jgi:hypothetical protein
MDEYRFDAMAKSLGGLRTRRAVVGLVAALSLGSLEATAKKKKRKKRKKKKHPSQPCAATCNSCCDGQACRAGNTASACGSGGEACAACAAGEGCQDGECVTLPCGAGGPCLAFATSTTYIGGLGGLTTADFLCQQRAAAASPAPLPGAYKAWLAVTSAGPNTRFVQSTGPYRLVDGTTIANDWADLTDGTLAAPINLTENGETFFDPSRVWTNVATNGTPAGSDDCVGWSSTQSFDSGGTGYALTGSATWTQDSSEPCLAERRLYCFQQS